MRRVIIRPERPGDSGGVHAVNRAAFGQDLEASLVDAIRVDAAITCSLVADSSSEIVGHILFTPVTADGIPEIRAAGLAPMAVRPGWQRRGIGTMLVESGLRECARLGMQVVVVLGHPGFYPRFGFQPASRFGLSCEFDVPDDVFMAMELTEGALTGRTGLVRYLPHFSR